MGGMTMQTEAGYRPRWTFGDRLRRVRRDAGLTQGAFAAVLNVGEKRYAAWESDSNTPRGDDLLAVVGRIRLRFGVDAGEFVMGFDASLDPNGPDGPDGPLEVPASTEDVAPTDELAALTAKKRTRTRRSGHTHG